MTQEIEKAIVDASQIYPAIHQKPYLDGGIFGYKLAIDKACEWLKEQSCCGYIEDIDVNEFIKQFKQTMKGE